MGDEWRKDPDKAMNYIARWKADVRAAVPMHYGNEWPEDRDRQWDPIFQALKKADRTAAWKVIDSLAASPPKSMADAIERIPGLIAKANESSSAAGAGKREDVRNRSKGCNACGGEGITSYVRSDGEPWQLRTVGGNDYEAMHRTLCCHLCESGRWMAANAKVYGDAREFSRIAKIEMAGELPAEADGPRDVRAELRAGINREFSPARAG